MSDITSKPPWPSLGCEPRGRSDVLRGLWRAVRGEVEIYRGSRALVIDLPLREEAVGGLLPACLRLGEARRGRLILLDHRDPGICLPYREAVLAIDVHGLYGPGMHFVWMGVDDDTAMIIGREWLGCPKKMLGIAITEKSDAIDVRVLRRSREVVHVRVVRVPSGRLDAVQRPVFGERTYTVGGPGQLLWWNPLWAFSPVERRLVDAEASAKVEWGAASDGQVLSRLVAPSSEPLAARVVDFDLTGGRSFLPAGVAGMTWFARTYGLRFM